MISAGLTSSSTRNALLDQKPRSPRRLRRESHHPPSQGGVDQMQGGGQWAGIACSSRHDPHVQRAHPPLSTQVVVYDEVGKAIGESRELQTLLDVILQQLSSATCADWGLLLLRFQFSDRLELRGQANLTLTAEQCEAVSNGQGFLGPVLQSPGDQVVASFDDQEPFKSCARLGFGDRLAPVVPDHRRTATPGSDRAGWQRARPVRPERAQPGSRSCPPGCTGHSQCPTP